MELLDEAAQECTKHVIIAELLVGRAAHVPGKQHGPRRLEQETRLQILEDSRREHNANYRETC